MTYLCLKKKNALRGVCADWDEWINEAHNLYMRHLDLGFLSPLQYHEVSATGFLAAAAARKDFLTSQEYEIVKRSQLDRRINKSGRADLWITNEKRCYSLEFKRAWNIATVKNLENTMSKAKSDISVIQRAESDYAAAGVLAFVSDAARVSVYEDFMHREVVDFAYHIGPDGENGAYIFFAIKN